MPPHHLECREIQELLMETLSGDSQGIPEDLQNHLAGCPECRSAMEDLLLLKGSLKSEALILPAVPAAIWDSVADKLDGCPQRSQPEGRVSSVAESAPSLLAQYVYLVTLGLTVWTCLVFGQPLFVAFLQSQGLGFSHWLLEEYSLFILFFTSGAFVAILAAPILIGWNSAGEPEPGLFRQLFRAFSGKLRLFAC